VLDERSLRRPDINESECCPIVLADGQAWLFPKPYVDYTPRFEDGKAVLAIESEFTPYLDRFEAAETVGEVFCTRFDLARTMLLKVYDLTDEQLPALLKTRRDSEADQERWNEIYHVAAGFGPKPSPGGESSA